MKNKIRIVYKTKEGPTLKVSGKEIKYSWENFNKQFNIQDNVWAILKPEIKQKLEEIDHKITYMAMISLMQGNGKQPDLTDLALLGQYTKDTQEFFNCTGLEVIKLVQDKVKALKDAFHAYQKPSPKKDVKFPHASQSISEAKEFDELKKKFGL